MKKTGGKGRFGDHDIEQFIGRQLQLGVLLSSIIVLIGGVLYLAQSNGLPLPDYKVFIGEKAGLTTSRQILGDVADLKAKGIIQLGVAVLIATPVLRVFFSLIGFILEKDRLYIGITLIVLTMMMISIFGGLKG